MGLLFSCCRRRKQSSDDREPLLPQNRVNAAADDLLPAQERLDRLADVVGALKAGKLPSQDQLAHVLRLLIRSTATTAPGQEEALSEPGKRLLDDVHAVLESLVQFGLEKNDDNVIQEGIYQMLQVPAVPVHADVVINAGASEVLNIEAITDAVPSEQEVTADVAELLQALSDISVVILTSTTFRLLLSGFFAIVREIIADTAADVSQLAATIQQSAAKIEEAVRPENTSPSGVQTPVGAARETHDATQFSGDTARQRKAPGHQHTSRTKDVIIGKVLQLVSETNSHPSYRAALRTMLSLLQKYATKTTQVVDALSDAEAPSVTPLIWTDPHLRAIMSHAFVLLSRMSSKRSLDRWADHLRTVASDFSSIPTELTEQIEERREWQSVLSGVGDWFDAALSDPLFAVSADGRRGAEDLLDLLQALWRRASESHRPWASHVRAVVDDTEVILDALCKDRTTSRLFNGLSALSRSFSEYAHTFLASAPYQLDISSQKLRREVQREVLSWLLPRVLRALHAIPLPRVEYRSNKLDAAADTLRLTPTSAHASLVPDHVRVQNWTEIQLDMTSDTSASASDGAVSASAMTRTRLHVEIDGVRVSAKDVSYYVCWRAFGRARWLKWIGYEDEGLISVDIGRRGVRGEGASLAIELEFNQLADEDSGIEEDCPLFVVRYVRADVPGLGVSLDKSKHWILNKLLLQPLSGPTGRAAVGWVLAQQIEASLNGLAILAGGTSREASKVAREQKRDVQFNDYALALWRALKGTSEEKCSEDDDNPADDQTTLVHTHLTTKGMVRTTEVWPGPESQDDAVEESVLAIGIGEQILPGKGGPHTEPRATSNHYGATDLARDALDEIQIRVDQLADAGDVVVDRATQTRQGFSHATAREQYREQRERRRGGWRSNAFSL